MISNPFFLLSLFFNSFLAFFIVAFIVDASIKILSIERYRIRATLRLLPFLSLLFDFLLNQYSIASWINPLSCTSCLQKFILWLFFPELKAHLAQNQISLLNYLGLTYQYSLFSALFIVLVAISFCSVLIQLIRAFSLMHSLHSIAKRAALCGQLVLSTRLQEVLIKKNAVICCSDETQIPLAVYPNVIIIPQKTVEILSSDELQAVIAHEWEHIKYRDPLIRLLCHSIAAFFWWVPTAYWMKDIEHEQEIACDQNTSEYNVDGEAIASALLKVIKQVNKQQLICYFTAQQQGILVRMQVALGVGKKKEKAFFTHKFFTLFYTAFFLLICMLCF